MSRSIMRRYLRLVSLSTLLPSDRVSDGAELGGEDALGLDRADPVE
ncbi:hypothetical protein [Nocardia abscessus]|nr:hypothetical protein [Nocardia abscessus]